MTGVTIRINYRNPDGKIEDGQQDFGLEDFGGVLPAVGDLILNPGVLQGLNRRDPANREIWTVVGRIFNPRDLGGEYIGLIVEVRAPTEADIDLV